MRRTFGFIISVALVACSSPRPEFGQSNSEESSPDAGLSEDAVEAGANKPASQEASVAHPSGQDAAAPLPTEPVADSGGIDLPTPDSAGAPLPLKCEVDRNCPSEHLCLSNLCVEIAQKQILVTPGLHDSGGGLVSDS